MSFGNTKEVMPWNNCLIWFFHQLQIKSYQGRKPDCHYELMLFSGVYFLECVIISHLTSLCCCISAVLLFYHNSSTFNSKHYFWVWKDAALVPKSKWITFVRSEVETQPSGPPKLVRIFQYSLNGTCWEKACSNWSKWHNAH